MCVRAQTPKSRRERIEGIATGNEDVRIRFLRGANWQQINHTPTPQLANTTITDTQEIEVMNESNKTPLVIALVVVVVLFLIFGGGAMTGSMMGGGMMGQGGYRMGQSWINGGFSWMWIPTLLTLGLGVLLGWAIFGKK
jgi:hypothetical protein